MKIIGTTQGGYLLDATTAEIDALAGKTLSRQEGYYGNRICSVGEEFAICPAWQQIHRNEGRMREIEMIRESLEGAITHLKMTVPFLQEPPSQGGEK